MLQRIFALVLFCSLAVTQAQAQQPIEVPKQVDFGGLELKLHPHVREQIQEFADKLTQNARFFRQIVERADAYFPLVEAELATVGVPDDFKYLTIQESSLVSDVVSRSNAVGFWQFKEATGVEVGLRIDNTMDERKNIVASTRAAATYLQRNNYTLKNWVYALLSYYTGPTGAKKHVKEKYVGARKMELGKDTHWYVIRFLAHKLVFENAIHRNIQNPPLQVMRYDNCEGLTLQEIAEEVNLDPEDVAFYNKWLTAKRIPTDGDFTVLLPFEQDAVYVAKVDQLPKKGTENLKPYKKPNLIQSILGIEPKITEADYNISSDAPILLSWNGIKAIQAKADDNISKLAIEGGISRNEFLKYNELRIFDKISEGQVYYLKRKKNKAKVPFHVVKADETLWEISQMYGIKIKAILRKNLMDAPQRLKPGRVLYLRDKRPENEPIKYENVPVPQKPKYPKVAQTSTTQKQPENPDTTQPHHSPQPKADDNQTQNQQPPKQPTTTPTQPLADTSIAQPTKPNITADKPNTRRQTNYEVPYVVTDSIQGDFMIHTIVMGETLMGISRLYDVPLDSITTWSNMAPQDLRLGAQLKIKTRAARENDLKNAIMRKQQAEDKTNNNGKPQAQSDYVVKPVIKHKVATGQTLYAIARQYGVAVADLKQWNDMTDNAIAVGQELIIKSPTKLPDDDQAATPPEPQPEKTVAKAPKGVKHTYHTVAPGETLFAISRQYNVTLTNLLQWNNKKDTNIAPNDKLLILLE